ncbi:MAG: VWA domain-containing protein [Candidatus Micrarchaeota archaeon]|nr:VWA domain-containing protein [Candidatus Micrarchaeota archaeon]MDE1846823.1 VWA domain-containing protein [Candidatus Micrarchaeota archaeon]
MDPKDVNVEGLVREHLEKKGWNIVYGLEINRNRVERLIDASINRRSWRITIDIDPSYAEMQVKRLEGSGIGWIGEPIEKCIQHVLDHEYAHWEVCPADLVYFERIISGVGKGLEDAGFTRERIEEMAPYVTNMFNDVIVNSVQGLRSQRYAEGMAVMQYNTLSSGAGTADPGEHDYYVIFADSFMKLLKGNDSIRRIAESYAGDYGSLGRVSQKLLGTIVGARLAGKAFADKLENGDISKIEILMQDEAGWGKKAREFAKIIGPHLRNVDAKSCASLIPLKGMAKDFVKDGKFRKEVIEAGIKAGGNLLYAREYEVFDEIYRKNAGEIGIRAPSASGETPRVTLFDMVQRRHDEDRPIDDKIDWEKTIFVNDSPMLFRKDAPYDIELKGVSPSGGYRDLLFIIDCSGSMAWENKPLDGSKYDICIRVVYACINYLESIQKASFLNYGLVQFSRKTLWSGWNSYGNLPKLKHMLFEQYQGDTTRLDPGVIDSVSNSRRDKFLAIMVSDGAMENRDSAAAACRRMMKAGNDIVLFEAQSRDIFADMIRKDGGVTVYVNNPKDLIKLSLDVVKSRYGVVKIGNEKDAEDKESAQKKMRA